MNDKISDTFLEAALNVGRVYLISGGSISNLEAQLTIAGERLGLSTSVHATPTGITISCINAVTGQSKSLSTRIGGMAPHLSQLVFVDRLLSLFSRGIVLSHRLLGQLRKVKDVRSYPKFLMFIAVFVVGVTATFNRSLSIQMSAFGGIVTLVSFFICQKLAKKMQMPEAMQDSLLCFISISLSILVANHFQVHPSQIFIGAMALVLPGLTLTSAVGDLIEEQYHTGLVKLAKAGLTLLAMGFTYILARETMSILGFVKESVVIESQKGEPLFLSSLLSTLGMLLSFCILFKVPLRAIWGTLCVGSIGWFLFHSLISRGHPVAAAFFSAMVISLLSRPFAKLQRTVPQVYVVPGLLVLVPGLLAFSYLQPLVDSKSAAEAFRSVLMSLMLASALSIGLLIGQAKKTQVLKNA